MPKSPRHISSPLVTELPLPLEPCTPDPFIDDLAPARPAADAHRRQVALVRQSLLVSTRRDRPTHHRRG
jgi:hypothetical protein